MTLDLFMFSGVREIGDLWWGVGDLGWGGWLNWGSRGIVGWGSMGVLCVHICIISIQLYNVCKWKISNKQIYKKKKSHSIPWLGCRKMCP